MSINEAGWHDFSSTHASDIADVYGPDAAFRVSDGVWRVAEEAINDPDAFDPEGLTDLIGYDLIFMSSRGIEPTFEPARSTFLAMKEAYPRAKGFACLIPTRPDIRDGDQRDQHQWKVFFRLPNTIGREARILVSIVTADELPSLMSDEKALAKLGGDIEIEIEFIGDGSNMIKARKIGVPTWDDITPTDFHPDSGYEFHELRALGEGRHQVKKKSPSR